MQGPPFDVLMKSFAAWEMASMTPDRFSECLNLIRWTPIDLVNALHCDLAWIEALESGEIAIPKDVASWIENLARAHNENQPPIAYRAKLSGPAEARLLKREPTDHREDYR